MKLSKLGQLVILVALALLVPCGLLLAGVTASLSGTVTDASGAVVSGATVTATNIDTGVASTQSTNAQGFYSFPELPPGKYTIDVQQAGFKQYTQKDLVLEVNNALTIDVALQVGATTEKIEVSATALHVDTETTQMGEVITGKEMTDVPLVSRSYTDLLALQPGVISTASQMTGAFAGPFISAGFPSPLISGDLNAGALSVNGMREADNGFILNGLLAQETGFSGAGAIPNLDSIGEFRIITNNFDAEYGNYSGGQINVVTKSGGNQFHGDGFEFLRNTDFDAANYFAGGQRGAYHQNQFGGTVGGPIVHDKIFFFADYQGNRVIQGATQLINGAPSAATESGDFAGIASQLTGKVSGPAFASALSSQLGYPVTSNEPYYFAGCSSNTQCVLPGATLPSSKFNPIASKILPFILPAQGAIDPTTGTGVYSTSAFSSRLDDNKFSGRIDANSSFGLLNAYYYFDKYNRLDPYWASNEPLYPGFGVKSLGQTHFVELGDTKTLSSASVNELRLGFFRLDTHFNVPSGGTGVTLGSLGFASGAGRAPGIFPLVPSLEGIPEIDFNDFTIGVPSRPNGLIENIYQGLDNYSKVIGTHSLKFGVEYHYDWLEEDLVDNVSNGNFFFGSNDTGQLSETGSDFVDFLLGAPTEYVQGQSYPSYGHNFYFGLYGQDSWRVRQNLTFNYGLRYDVSSPFAVKYNQIETLIPGEQSVVFPGSPLGWVFPGDPHVPSTLAPTRWNNFAPRLGMAYSFGPHDGMWGKILGAPGTTSIRAGWGLFYSTLEGATNFNEIGDAPFGNYTTQTETDFATPFTTRATGKTIDNFFPVPTPPANFSAKNPGHGSPYDNLTEFNAAFGTIGSSPAFWYKNQLPYAEDYELSIERQLTHSDLLTVSYVGTQGHHLLSSESANPGDPALCLSVSQTIEVAPGTTPCGPGGENNVYTRANGSLVIGTRPRFPGVVLPNGTPIVPIGNDSWFITGAYSAYNSAQINYRHTSGRLQTLVGYTFSKSLDNSSGYGEQYNPIDPRLSRGLSAFDSTHNFVASYSYRLPIDLLGGPRRLVSGWSISGITRFATGLPVTLVESDDQSLLGTSFGGPIIQPVDTPNIIGPLDITDPRKTSGRFFNPAAFGPSALGQEGDADRRFFHGPGINNWDMALLKDTHLTERYDLEFRAEFFNIFNHTQFLGPNGVTGFSAGVPTSSSFGFVAGAANPRIGQLSLKFYF